MFDQISIQTEMGQTILQTHDLNQWWKVVNIITSKQGQSPLEMMWRTIVGNQEELTGIQATKDLEKSFLNFVLFQMAQHYKPHRNRNAQSEDYWSTQTEYLNLRKTENLLPTKEDITHACEVWDQAIKRKAEVTPPEFHAMKKWLQNAMMMSGRRRVMLTANGNLGLAPESCCVGDMVVFIQGAKTPFILRRTSSDRFELVGEAYLHGYMNGEICREGLPDFVPIIIE